MWQLGGASTQPPLPRQSTWARPRGGRLPSPVGANQWGQPPPPVATNGPRRRRVRQRPEGGQAIWAVDVQDVEADPGGQADIGLDPTVPPAADPVSVGGGVLDAVADQGMLCRRGTAPP